MAKEKEGDIRTAYEMDYSAPDAVREHYAAWAAAYDRDTESYGYVGPMEAARLLVAHLPDKAAAILDVGCGTGLVGSALAGLGYRGIDGTDLSPEMIEVCGTKGVYRTLRCDDLMEGIDVPDGSYDAVISVGTFGPLGPDLLPNALRPVRPGGLACISVNEIFLEATGFLEALRALGDTGGWDMVLQEKRPHMVEGGHEALVTLCRRAV